MTLCYIHRPGSHSAIIREASSYKRWELLCTVRNLGTLSSKWDAFSKLLPSGFRESCERGGRKSVRARGDEDTKGTVLSRHNRTSTRMNSQKLAACAAT